MPNSNEIKSRLIELGDTSGSNAKKVILKKALEDDLFRYVAIQATDPMITFGIKDLSFLDEVKESGKRALSVDNFHGSSFVRVLEKLKERTITGSAAKIALKGLVKDYDEATRHILDAILTKNLATGVGASMVNRVAPGTVFEFNVMLAAKWEPEKIVYPVSVEPKYDGMRLLAIGDQDGFEFFTRTGKRVETISEGIKRSLSMMYGWGIDSWLPTGEMVFDGELMGESFADTMSQARKKDHVYEGGNFYVFDAFTIEEFRSLKKKPNPTLTYKARRQKLAKVYSDFVEGVPGVKLPPSYICRNETEVLDYFVKFRERGLEGLIIKNPAGQYHPRRNRDWMKLKDVNSVDLPIIEAVEGTGKYVGQLGALVVMHNGVQVNVGSGFTDSDRKDIWNSYNEGWLDGKIIEVEYHEETPDGSLRHPRFKRFRDDKRLSDGPGS